MKNYIVRFEARNVRISNEISASGRSNFMTFFHCSANDPEAALAAAETLLGKDAKIAALLDQSPEFDPPECVLECEGQVETFENRAMPRTGLIFFDDEPSVEAESETSVKPR